jgi:type IV pilus assembly protein PilA
MLKKLRNTNEKGFTLIELMIVIAIIGILAAIAIPNFISYRNQGYCSAAERDAASVAAALGDYFSDPANDVLPATHGDLGLTLSGANSAAIGGAINGEITITITDGSAICPKGNTFITTMGGADGAWSTVGSGS